MFLVTYLLACQPDWITEPNKNDSVIYESNYEPTTESEPEEPLAPVANISVPESHLLDSQITFDGSNSYDPQGFELEFLWDCSNGQTSSEETISFWAEEIGEIICDLEVESVANLSSEDSKKTQIVTRPERADWTVMVFIAGDNNLEEAGLEDINEMEAAGSTDQVNILTQIDRSPYYSESEGDWSGSRRFYVTGDNSPQITSPVMMDLGNIDSGNPSVVADFARWGIENYPAEKYAFIVWNHGWSWSLTNQTALTKGLSSDDSTGNDISIAEGELDQLLAEVMEVSGGQLEVFGIDACIMQSWEIAHEVSPYAKYYVASQDYESFDGWDYEHALLDLIADPEMDGADFGESIAYRFFQTGDLTQSVLDLAQLPAFETTLDAFAESMMQEGSNQLFRQAAQSVYSYDGSRGEDRDIGGMLSYVASHTDSTELQEKAEQANLALQNLVISNYAIDYASDAKGLNIYAPPQRNWGLYQSYLDASWSSNSLWDDMLVHFD